MDQKEGTLSRREFVKLTGAGIAGAGLAASSLGALNGNAWTEVQPPKLLWKKVQS